MSSLVPKFNKTLSPTQVSASSLLSGLVLISFRELLSSAFQLKNRLAAIRATTAIAGNMNLQIGLDSLPVNAIGTLNALQPLLKALSADNVQPLAVTQLQTIGTLFHSNGPLARKMPDLLVQTTSARLQKLSILVGWAKGDTGTIMAQSAGGGTIALLSLILRELFDTDMASDILFQFSENNLDSDQCHSSYEQIGGVVETLA